MWNSNPRHNGLRSELTHTFNALLGFQITPRTRFVITDSLWWSGDKTWNYGENYVYSPEEQTARNDSHYMNKLAASMSFELTVNIKANIHGSYNIKRYDNSNLARLYDEDLYTLGGSVNQVFNRHFSYGVYSTYTTFDRATHGKVEDRPGPVDNGVAYLSSGVQAAYDFLGDKRFVFSGSTGHSMYWYEADNIPNEQRWGDLFLRLTMYQQERTGGSVGLRLGRTYSDLFPYSSQGDFSVDASIFTTIGRPNKRNVKVGANASLHRRTFKIQHLDDDTDHALWMRWLSENGYAEKGNHDVYAARVWASYRLTQNIDTSCFFGYNETISDVSNDYSEQTIGGSVTIKFDSMKSLF